MNFNEELSKRSEYAEKVVSSFLPKDAGYADRVLEAMNYSVLSGGKRLRPVMMHETYVMYGGEGDMINPFMAAIEMIHTYSLVHDDLPAMDNDMYRRGKKTTHAVYGPGIATLAGDGLLNLAFETALKAFSIAKIKGFAIEPRIVEALEILSDKAGIYGMLGGQSADVDAEERQRDIGKEELLFIHEKKTACLLQSSLMIGAIMAGAPQDEVSKIEEIGRDLGVAFQIRDDILDVEGDYNILGKSVGSDAKNGKSTYVTLFGMEKAKEDERALSNRALKTLKDLSVENPFLTELIEYLVTRQK